MKSKTDENKTDWNLIVFMILVFGFLGYGLYSANQPTERIVYTSLPASPKFFPNSDVKIPAELDARIHTLRVNEWKGNLYEEVVRLMARGATMRVAFGTVMIAQREVKKSDAYTALTDNDRATLDEATENFQSEMFELIPSEGAKPTQ